MDRLRFKLLGLAMVLVFSSVCFAEEPEIVNDNKDVLTPGARLVAGLPGKNDFYILSKNEKMPAELVEQKKAPRIVIDKTKQVQAVVQNTIEAASASAADQSPSLTATQTSNDLAAQPVLPSGKPADATIQSVSQTLNIQTSQKQSDASHSVAAEKKAVTSQSTQKNKAINANHASNASKKLADKSVISKSASKALTQNNSAKKIASKKLTQASAGRNSDHKKIGQGNIISKGLAKNNPKHHPAKTTKKLADRQDRPAYLQYGKV